MSKKIKLFNTAVKKPDGTWLGGAALGINGSSSKSFAAGTRYYKGFLRAWNLVRHGDFFEASRAITVEAPGKDTSTTAVATEMSLSNPVVMASDFPVGKLTGFSGHCTETVDIAVHPEVVNNTAISFRLLAPRSTSFSSNYIYAVAYSATRAELPKTSDIDNSSTNIKTGNSYGTDAVEIAKSYYKACSTGARKLKYGENWSYGNIDKPNNRLNDEDGYGLMQCDTLALMVMLGLPYADSPYSKNVDAVTGLGEANATQFEDELAVNKSENYWATNWFAMEDVGGKRIYKNAYGYSAIADTSEELWDFWRRGWCFSALDKNGRFDKSLVKDGDIVIFREPGADFYDGITHIAICSIEGEKLYIYHVTSSRLNGNRVIDGVQQKDDGKIAWRTSWEDYMGYHYDYTIENFYFARPDYAALQGGDPTP